VSVVADHTGEWQADLFYYHVSGLRFDPLSCHLSLTNKKYMTTDISQIPWLPIAGSVIRCTCCVCQLRSHGELTLRLSVCLVLKMPLQYHLKTFVWLWLQSRGRVPKT